ncbi:MAG: glucoamylase family protein [Acidobacteriia bacterium]|nr:glucoamylase family protein [Terriglobia bacterium]
MAKQASRQQSATNTVEVQEAATAKNPMEILAREHAEAGVIAGEAVPKRSFLIHFKEQEELVRHATHRFSEDSARGPLSYAAEWMLDNFYLVQQSFRQVRNDMPPDFYGQLPLLRSSSLKGHPRIRAVAQELVVMDGARLDMDRVKHLIDLYQDITPLTMGELWALPAMLRLSTLECLAQTLSRITGLQSENIFPAATLFQPMKDDEIVANCITSLRSLASQDWQSFFESVSRVEQTLRSDPAKVYSKMDRETRDRYRKVIEELAHATGEDEQQVAQEVLGLARANRSSDRPRVTHVGYFLLDSGRKQLEARLGYRASWRAGLNRCLFGHPTLAYLGSIGLITLILLFEGLTYARSFGFSVLQCLGAAILLIIPGLTVSVSLVNWIINLLVPPRVLPKMDFGEGIPGECKTMLVVPSLLTGADEVKSLLQQLELHFLRNPDPNMFFALLTDLPDAPRRRLPERDDLIDQTASGIRALNEKYPRKTPNPFYLFHRDSKWNPREERWMGWERKRGKLHQLNLLLRGSGKAAFSVQVGDLNVLREIKYVITLDSDTIIPREAASRLVATLAHPLNHAEFDPQRGTVSAGYTLLQPAIEITSTSAYLSRFTRIFAGDVGLDLYTRAVSDVYQDLFGHGIFVGKGIYDVDAFERSLADRMPENALLSHDLIEGIHGRVGLVTDIVLFEDYPPHYFVYLRRSRRWIRGDWQLLPWLFPRVPSVEKGTLPNSLSLIDRWKILDNLRRSLLSPALFALFIADWLWLPGSPATWTLAGLLTPAMPVLTGLSSGLFQARRRRSWQSAFHPLRNGLMRWILALAFVPYETLITLTGIATTLVRLFITRKHLLRWTSYADTVRLFAGEMTFKQMFAAISLTAALAWLTARADPVSLFAATPLLIAWVLSPEIAYWISRPLPHAPAPLSMDERLRLRRLARRTWLFFEEFVGPEDHWLPPDHFQESPRSRVTHSTSPTDLGTLLLSTLAAYDLGYIGLADLNSRLQATFDGMDRLQRYQGHLLNWSDSRSLEPLAPRYVSTVDSGNLAACLQTLSQGLQDIIRRPIARWQSWEGFLDTLALLDELMEDLAATGLKSSVASCQTRLAQTRRQVQAERDHPHAWSSLLHKITEECGTEMSHLLASLVASKAEVMSSEMLRRLNLAADRVRNHLYGMEREIGQLVPWLPLMSQPPRLFALPDTPLTLLGAWQTLVAALPITSTLEELETVCRTGLDRLAELRSLLSAHFPDYSTRNGAGDDISSFHEKHIGELPPWQEAGEWCESLAKRLEVTLNTAETLMMDFRDAGRKTEEYFHAMDFSFLFDPQRQLFHIGYNAETERLDNNYYDLLASEAQISSLVTIAKNEVPRSHWLHLGRPLTQLDGTRALLSWGGTMFEYLMPLLLVRSYEGTLLQHTCLAAVDRQIAYGRQKKVPWGISESGYFAFDADQNYQYRTFGVPGLGFKRNLDEDLVVAPYASLLALSLRPQQVMENLARLVQLQMLGTYGLYESIDFSASRLALGQNHAVVRSYMSHHQGMILLSLVNYLHDNVMVRRFHADPLVRSVELLLQEKVPYEAPLESVQPEGGRATQRDPAQRQIIASPWSVPVQSPAPQVHFLSNGRYGVMITSAGAGYSCWQGIDLTRWRADTTQEDCGTWIYLQDTETGDLWSAAFQPTGEPSESQDTQFYPHMAEFRRGDHGIGLTMEITVAPEEDVEIRRISLTNRSDRARRIALTSYDEVILAPQAADSRHPALNKMFIASEYLPESNALLFHRRAQSTEEEPVYLAHFAIVSPGQEITAAYETDRARFLGRGQTLRAPAALNLTDGKLFGTTGATLDPIMALGQTVELRPHGSGQVSFVTLVARSHAKALKLARRFQDPRVIVRAFEQARSRAELELYQLNLTSADLEQIQELLSALIYPRAALRAEATILAANRKGQADLWPFSISGDNPILLVRLYKSEDLALVERAVQAHTYWRIRHISVDLVLLNEQGTSYSQELRGQLQRLLVHLNSEDWLNRRGGIFILYADQLTESDRVLLETSARAVLDAAKGPLTRQLEALRKQPPRLPPFVPVHLDSKAESTPQLARPRDLLFDNGFGGFSPDGREYVIYLQPHQWTPAPWINVVANPDFGFTVSEAGSGCTWHGNSSEHRLTPWFNDPVSDLPGEAIYLRDEETAEIWSPTPRPCRTPDPYLIRHGAGYSFFEHNSHGLLHRLRLFVAQDAPVKVMHLRLENTWAHTRRITATLYLEWVLGSSREATQQYLVSEFDSDHQALLVRNTYQREFHTRTAFAAASKNLHGLTADRTEFLGRMGDVGHPAGLDRIGLSSVVEPGLDPCGVLQLHLDLKPGESEEIFFLMGEGENREEALKLIEQFQNGDHVELAWDQVNQFWNNLLGRVQVQTPDVPMNLLLNRWLLYQTLSCRLWGRTAFYQSSGAFGFRDQLQDVMALLHAAPHLAREHVLESARQQFEAGDVLHWWHPPSGQGVRTRCSDDLLWLPYVTGYYVAATGDESILDEKIPFRQGLPLETGEVERFDRFPPTVDLYTLYEHCCRSIEKGTTAGAHGLPLMGNGDWNDGMNRVGIQGRGESVWLGWFLCATFNAFAEQCSHRGELSQARAFRQRALQLSAAIEANAWDGQWYRRAFYDDGTPLGSASNEECQIDSIAQSWAVLSAMGDLGRAANAIQSAAERLERPEHQLLLLLTPPFDQTSRAPGYIKAYPPGIRENGGQYTHAALWLVWAFAQLGLGDRAELLFHWLNPINHSDTFEKASKYGVEPYVVAADVYGVAPHIGRGGWTWYTGASSWMYRAGLEALLGIRRKAQTLQFSPCIPTTWPGYQVTYRFGETTYQIHVANPSQVSSGVINVLLDGKDVEGKQIPLVDDRGQHEVQVLMG